MAEDVVISLEVLTNDLLELVSTVLDVSGLFGLVVVLVETSGDVVLGSFFFL